MARGTRWTPPEDETLMSLSGDIPWPMVVDHFNRWAKRMGHPPRTETALIRRCDLKGISRRAVGEWVTTGVVCELLGISYETVRRWMLVEGFLPYRRFGNSRQHNFYVRRADLRRLATQRPHLFGGQSVSTLTQLLDSPRLAERIAKMQLKSPRQAVPVVCLETGRRYSSIFKAARAAYVTPQRLRAVLQRPTQTAAGYHWRIAS